MRKMRRDVYVHRKFPSIHAAKLRRIQYLPSFANFSFHNLLPPPLADDLPDLKFLGLGPRFCPRPTAPPVATYVCSIGQFTRRIRVYDFFHNVCNIAQNDDYDPRLQARNTWLPPENTAECHTVIEYINNKSSAILSNHVLTSPDRITRAMRRLSNDPRVKIVLSDKNMGIVVLPIETYDDMVWAHLSDGEHYAHVGPVNCEQWVDILNTLRIRSATLMFQAKHLGLLTNQAKNFLNQGDESLPKFHVLPKLHKRTPPGVPIPSRPIVGAVKWITTNWAIFLATKLEAVTVEHSLRDSTELVIDFERTPLNDQDLLVTGDVTSLYTMMSLERLYRVVRQELRQIHSDQIAEFMVTVLEVICKSNYFLYGETVFHQTDGIAMGCNAAVYCANIYLKDFDHRFVRCFKYYRRYIDDIFAVYIYGIDALERTASAMGEYIAGITVNFNYSYDSVDFLDLTVYKLRGRAAFKTYQKPNNCYQYIPPSSFHNPACISGYIRGECIRYVRTNTCLQDRLAMILLFRRRLLARSFSTTFVDNIIMRVNPHARDEYLRPRVRERDDKVMTLSIPFNMSPTTTAFRDMIRTLNSMPTCQAIKLQFRIAFQRNPNILALSSTSNISDNQATYLAIHNKRQRLR